MDTTMKYGMGIVAGLGIAVGGLISLLGRVRTVSLNGKAFIKEREGFAETAYQDTGGTWTIGYGHTSGVKQGDKITRAEAEKQYEQDLKEFERTVAGQRLRVNQNQFDALVSLCYNIGTGNFLNSTVLKKAKQNPKDESIGDAFRLWKYSGGKVTQGLVNRREAEVKLYFS